VSRSLTMWGGRCAFGQGSGSEGQTLAADDLRALLAEWERHPLADLVAFSEQEGWPLRPDETNATPLDDPD